MKVISIIITLYDIIQIRMKQRKMLILLVSLSLLLFLAQAQPNICYSPCSACQTGSTSKCTQCSSGFTILGDYCVTAACPILYCKVCSNTNLFAYQCLVCQTNFVLINNLCVCQGNFTSSLPGSLSATCVCPTQSTSNSSVLCHACSIPQIIEMQLRRQIY